MLVALRVQHGWSPRCKRCSWGQGHRGAATIACQRLTFGAAQDKCLASSMFRSVLVGRRPVSRVIRYNIARAACRRRDARHEGLRGRDAKRARRRRDKPCGQWRRPRRRVH